MSPNRFRLSRSVAAAWAAAGMRAWTNLCVCLLLAACGNTPPAPDWQLNAKASLDRAVDAQLSGNARVAEAEYARARGELARTGRAALVARAELLRCAAEVAALQFGPCHALQPLWPDLPPAERAYAEHLVGTLDPARWPLLPPAQQALAALPSAPAAPVAVAATGLSPGPGAAASAGAAFGAWRGGDDGRTADVARLAAVTDPLSRLVGAARWQREGRASPAVAAYAADTAAAQGWRRPLLAWLAVLKQHALQAGDGEAAAHIGRRIALVLGGPPTP